MLYSRLIRPILFTRDAEDAHESALRLLERSAGMLACSRPLSNPSLTAHVAGISFPNPIGLAAGCDKNGRAVRVWPRFGFGFVEIGTVTCRPQPGNDRPRVYRIARSNAIVNRLGFNSEGSEAVAKRLRLLRERARPLCVPLGVNIGKTKAAVSDEEVLEDYRTSFRRLSPYADFVVVNVSSPNTPGLRQWQQRGPLQSLLGAIAHESRELTAARASGQPAPVFVKISPDMADSDMAAVVEVAGTLGLAGIIATNTTISRPDGPAYPSIEGGLSGAPLRERANEVMRFLYREASGRLPLIGVGGISSAEHAYQRIRSGASLVQLYTGMVYEGPYLARRINQGLTALLRRDGLTNISQAVGIASTGG